MLGTIVAFSATANSKAARAFYEGKLGLRFVEESPFALVFDSGGIQLRIQKVQHVDASPYTLLGWHVGDLDAAIDALVEKGVMFERWGFLEQDERGVWTAPSGARVAWMKDPDGNLLSIHSEP